MENDLVKTAMAEWEAGNLFKAEALLLKAAESGNGLASHNLGTLYAVGGPGVKADSAKSRYWFEKALESGFEQTVASDPTWFRK
jgi:TPR repeat protein